MAEQGLTGRSALGRGDIRWGTTRRGVRQTVGKTARLTAVLTTLVVSAGVMPVRADMVPPATVGPSKRCVHPHPCGGEWPAELVGATFGVGPTEHVKVPSSTYETDGVQLDGWLIRPTVPPGVKVPVLLHSSHHFGSCYANMAGPPVCRSTPDDPAVMDDSFTGPGAAVYHWGTPALGLVRRGYALAMFSVRGTGRSGGCMSLLSRDEQKDQVALVNWAAAQPWSNGRVGMGGISAPAATAWEAATDVETPHALKTIVTAGIVTDLYLLGRTPQGAVLNSLVLPAREPGHSAPPLGGAQHTLAQEGSAQDIAGAYPDRLCPDRPEETASPPLRLITPDRHAEYWAERRLIDRVGDVTAAVLLAQGFQEDFHAWQDDVVWEALRQAPKRRVVGQWAHEFPYGTDYPDPTYRVELDPSWRSNQWGSLVTSWLDYWLKGIGSPERLGIADYQDQNGTWRSSRTWPPKDARDEVVYLAGDNLSPAPDEADRSFRSVPNLMNSYDGATAIESPYRPYAAMCAEAVPGGAQTGLAYLSPPVTESTVLAGNAFAYLRLRSDQPGGLVTAKLVDVGPGFACDAAGQPTDIALIQRAAADLRFHHGNFVAEDFPADPTRVRLDFPDLAYELKPRHRLALTLSYGETHIDFVQAPYFPQIDVLGGTASTSSHLVLPFVKGTLHGDKPRLACPPRPFAPA